MFLHSLFSFFRKPAVYTVICSIFFFTGIVFGQKKKVRKEPPAPLMVAKNGDLLYTPDSLGNRIVDFSYCGYMESDKPIPHVAVKVRVPLKPGDATLRIQSAIDYVAHLPLNSEGLRGAILLDRGVYHINGSLKIGVSGIVLRGSGMGEDGTVLSADGTDRATLIIVSGKEDKILFHEMNVTDHYVPVGAMKITVASGSDFHVGDNVIVRRPSVQQWIDDLGTKTFGGGLSALGWKPGQRDLFWDRKITAIDGNLISLDAPLTTALDVKYGGGTISRYTWPGRIQQIGIENLRCVSAYDKANPKDEAHRWMAITMDNIQDGWVRSVAFEHFAGSAVDLLSCSKRITVQDCESLNPISEIGGQRRYTFWTSGQQTLFQRLYSEHGYHDFAVGYCAAGPNAFVQCEADESLGYSGPVDSWASGVLFDVVRDDGQELSYKNLGQDQQGAGWNAAGSVFWNCYAALVDCYKPPTAQNYAFGTWAQFNGDGYWSQSNNWIEPRSLFYSQLRQRLHRDIEEQALLQPMESEASSSPTVKVAAQLTKEAYYPRQTMLDWIDKTVKQNPIDLTYDNTKTIDELGIEKKTLVPQASPMVIKNGWLVRGGVVLTGKRNLVPWWNGSVKPDYLKIAQPAITRFVPGRTGTGLTDNLDSVTDHMLKGHVVLMEQNYGLWYDRRRDDHERVHRINGDVWPPFYELPFARSGQGTAWDGLSKYDLTKYNTWYWSRLKQFADLADEKGLVLIHHNYFQHNIIEAGAHYVDFPWRPVNNINHTGFPEPIHFAGDKRLFMGEQFYDETNAARRPLHQAFIRQCLNNFAGNSGVIQFICEEYTGPLHFAKFWIQTIHDWEKQTGKKETIGLSTTKDVQDSILADTQMTPVINVIDIRYWHYQADGTAYAPKGGQSLAPRQQARQFKPKKSSFEQVYRAVREYRDKYPDKAVMYSADSYDTFGWASFMAGGSLAPLPAALPQAFLADASSMLPVDLPGLPKGVWVLGNSKRGYIVYDSDAQPVSLDLKDNRDKFVLKRINAGDGTLMGDAQIIKGGKTVVISGVSKTAGAIVLWLSVKR